MIAKLMARWRATPCSLLFILLGRRESPHAGSLVGSVGVGSAVEGIRVYVEVIPREITDIVREPFMHIAEGRRPENDAIGYESLDDAIFNAEHVGACLLGEVIPQNLLLVFGQTLKSLDDALVEFPLPPEALEQIHAPAPYRNQEEHQRRKEKNPKNCAVILCKLKNPENILELLAAEKDQPGYKTNRYEIAWSELQELKKRLEEIGHINFPTNSLY